MKMKGKTSALNVKIRAYIKRNEFEEVVVRWMYIGESDHYNLENG